MPVICLEDKGGGRLRWKTENAGFNVQKNGGYNMEHAYRHGFSFERGRLHSCGEGFVSLKRDFASRVEKLGDQELGIRELGIGQNERD